MEVIMICGVMLMVELMCGSVCGWWLFGCVVGV